MSIRQLETSVTCSTSLNPEHPENSLQFDNVNKEGSTLSFMVRKRMAIQQLEVISSHHYRLAIAAPPYLFKVTELLSTLKTHRILTMSKKRKLITQLHGQEEMTILPPKSHLCVLSIIAPATGFKKGRKFGTTASNSLGLFFLCPRSFTMPFFLQQSSFLFVFTLCP